MSNNFWTGSHWDFWLVSKCSCDVFASRDVKFGMFSNFVNVVQIDLKIGTHIDWTYTMYLANKLIDKNNVTYMLYKKVTPRIHWFSKVLLYLINSLFSHRYLSGYRYNIKTSEQMNDVTRKYVNILHLTWESPTLLWTFKLLMRAGETRNSLNACLYYMDKPVNKFKNRRSFMQFLISI